MTATADVVYRGRADGHRFYLTMAAAFVVTAFASFTPTYWRPVLSGSFRAPPIIHVHGLLMFAWTLFFFFQTWLVARGRTMDHRSWGLFGIALFTTIVCSVLGGTLASVRHADAMGMGDAARRFSAVTLCGLPLMVGLFAVAIGKARETQVHRRLMIVLMSAMMTPAIARVFLALLAPAGGAGGPPPPFVSLPPSLIADLFIVVAIVRDWRVEGRPHPAYLWGGSVVVAQQVLTVPFAATAAWMRIAKAFEGVFG